MDCCRTCLSKSVLNKIFVCANKNLKCSKILLKATGLRIDMNDGLPQMMCTACIKYINNFLTFRANCKKSFKALVAQMQIKIEPSDILYSNDAISETNDRIITVNEIDDIEKDSKIINSKLNEYRNDNLNNKINNITENNAFSFINGQNINNTKEIPFNEFRNNDLNNKIDNVAENNVHGQNINVPSRENDSVSNDNHDYDDRNSYRIEDDVKEYEATIEDILRKPKDIVFENKRLNKKILLDYERVSKEKNDSNKEEMKKEIKEEPVECKYCHKIVKSKCALNNHYKIHTGRNIVCEHCGKKFTSKRRLLIHCKGKHGYKKTDKCKYCDYKGSSLEMVKIHERTHTGERPYACACGAAFHRRSSYLQHVPIHQVEKTVPCDECPALFKSVTLMKIHKNRHKTRRRRQIAAAAEQSSLKAIV